MTPDLVLGAEPDPRAAAEQDLASAADAAYELANELLARSHSDATIAQADELRALAGRLEGIAGLVQDAWLPITVGPLVIDPMTLRVTVRDQRVDLSRKEFLLLRTLAVDPTRVFSKEELLRVVWDPRSIGSGRTLDWHAFQLRRKLEHNGDRFVVNVWGVGYKLFDGPEA